MAPLDNGSSSLDHAARMTDLVPTLEDAAVHTAPSLDTQNLLNTTHLNSTHWTGIHWNGSPFNSVLWNGTHLSGSLWNSGLWNSSLWNSSLVNGSLWNGTLLPPTEGIMHGASDDAPLSHFSEWYGGVHGYFSLIVCVFGIILNVMNIIVLNQKNMVTSTNYILVALAVADMMTMIVYLPYALYFYCLTIPDPSYGHHRGWIIYLIFNANFSITCHTIAMWLTVALAVFRYIVVCHHTLGPNLCNLWRAKLTVVLVFFATIVFCVPNYVMHKTRPWPGGGWWFMENSFVTPFHRVFNYWLFGVVLKVAPCVLLTVLSSLLIHAMHVANRKRQRLKSMGKRAECERASEHNRTTAMLVAVVLCFVIAELPQGILAFLSGVDSAIFVKYYVPLGDVWDIIVLINSAVNFILYCIMSRQFRETFKEVFLKWCKKSFPKTPNGVQYSSINTQSTKL